MSPHSGRSGRPRWPAVATGTLVIAAAAAWIYAPALRGAWLWDDGLEIADNPILKDPAGWWKAWAAPSGMDYFPLKTALQWVEWRLWAGDAAGYHAVSLVLHVCSALLLWRLLARLGVRFAWLGGLIFAVHPVAVESVAWISEFKNTVSLPPLLLSLDAFVDWDATGSRKAYGLSVFWFLAAMLCKTTVAMAPFALLLHAWWRRANRARAPFRLRSLAPYSVFFAISAALGFVTLEFQWHRAMAGPGVSGGAAASWGGAGWALVETLWKLVWPAGLAPVYEPIRTGLPGALPWAAIAGAFALFWLFRSGWGRHATLCAGWMVLNLLPVTGLVPMAYLRVSPRADHFAYLSLVGIAGGAAAAFGALWPREGNARAPVFLRPVLACLAVVCTAALVSGSRAYAAAFRDGRALWSLAAARQPDAWLARNNWGRVLLGEGRPDRALAEFRAAARLRPDSAEVHANLGDALEGCGRPDEALAEYRTAVGLAPRFEGGHYDLGRLFLVQGRTSEAEAELRAAVRLDPGHAEAHDNLGLALARQGRLDEAVSEYRTALGLSPEMPEARLNLGNALFRLGRVDEAISEYRRAIERHPDYAAAHRNLAVALQSIGRFDEARKEYEVAEAPGAR